ncbi:hypothetical protein PybrP1_004033 [[Pythium] brassicae (nom. inval.)]|nr:hypothetical protein PybrP1_004033 [[Pythium] brassicae (nom. inval.)]
MAHQHDELNDAQTPTSVPYHDSEDHQALKVETAAGGDVDKEFKDQQQQLAHSPKTKRFFVWRLTKRKWIGAIVGSVVVVLGLLLLILWFAVAVPLFQSTADKVAVTLNHLDILDVAKVEDVRTLGVSLSLHLSHDMNVHAKTDATRVELLFGGAAFAALTLPALDLKKGKQESDLVIAGEADVTNAAVFKAMATKLVTDETVTVDASARLTAHVFGLSKGGIKFDRTLTFAAMNNFKKTATVVNQMAIKSCSASDIQIAINATIDNVGLVGLDGIGALNLSLYYEQDYLGYAVSQLPALGVPRGPSQQLLNLVMENSTSHLPVIVKMLRGVAFGSSQFWLTGQNDKSTEVGLLREPLRSLNMSIASKTSMLSKVVLNSQCDLISLVLG